MFQHCQGGNICSFLLHTILSFPFVIPHEILHLALPQQSAYHELTLLIYTHPASAADATGTSSIAPVLTFSANTDTAVPPDKSWL